MSDRNDLVGLKRFAKTLLKLDIQKTEMSPLVVKHPFTDSGIVGIQTPDGHLGIANLVESNFLGISHTVSIKQIFVLPNENARHYGFITCNPPGTCDY